MILCLDVGNTQIFGGLFSNETLNFRFRHDTRHPFSSDQIGIFLRDVLRENQFSHKDVEQIAICSVVPSLDYSLRSACIKYFDLEPFTLQAGIKTGLQIRYRNPLEVGADRIANAIAAIHLYPNENTIIVDFGTATTCCAISAKKEYLGGVILPGMHLSMNALQQNTAKLSPVEIIKPKTTLGRSTHESLQSGLYFTQLAAVRDICQRITQENFAGQIPNIIGTGGFAHLFEHEKVFSSTQTDLVLHGLRLSLAGQSLAEQKITLFQC